MIAALDVCKPDDELAILRMPGLRGRAARMVLVTGNTTALVFHGAGTALEVREFPLPACAARRSSWRCVACTLCGSDLHSLEGRRAVPVPTILGHEVLGLIAEFGPGAPGATRRGNPCVSATASPGASSRAAASVSIAAGSFRRSASGRPSTATSRSAPAAS